MILFKILLLTLWFFRIVIPPIILHLLNRWKSWLIWYAPYIWSLRRRGLKLNTVSVFTEISIILLWIWFLPFLAWLKCSYVPFIIRGIYLKGHMSLLFPFTLWHHLLLSSYWGLRFKTLNITRRWRNRLRLSFFLFLITPFWAPYSIGFNVISAIQHLFLLWKEVPREFLVIYFC